MAWTDAEEQWVRRCFHDGMSAAAAARASVAEIGRRMSRNAIIGKWHRMGLVRSGGQKGPQIRPPLVVGERRSGHEPSGCRYVIGEVGSEGGWRYCQEPQRPDSSYCPEHHAQCYMRMVDPDGDDWLNSASKGARNGRSRRRATHQGWA